MNSVETLDVNGNTVEIFQDTDPGDPRKEYDNFGTMVCLHRRYSLGDVQDMPVDEARKLEESDDVISLPLYMFDHSGLTIRTSDRMFRACDPQGWDWGKLGFIYATKKQVRENFMVKRVTKKIRERALEVLQAEVEEYNQFITGDVYGYVVTDKNGEEVDSLWGLFGLDYAKSEAILAASE